MNLLFWGLLAIIFFIIWLVILFHTPNLSANVFWGYLFFLLFIIFALLFFGSWGINELKGKKSYKKVKDEMKFPKASDFMSF